MFSIRKMQPIVVASAALCCYAGPVPAQESNVTYTASGIFATPPVSGEDVFFLAGAPFTITFVVNEAKKPTRYTETTAEYTDVFVNAKIIIGLGLLELYDRPVNLFLMAGAPNQPDWIFITFPYPFSGDTIIFTAKIMMPAGTIITPAIRPFTAPVTLTPSDGVMTYACHKCAAPWTGHSTTLGIAEGTLTGTAP